MKIKLFGYIIEFRFSINTKEQLESMKSLSRGMIAYQSSVFKSKLIEESGMPIENVPACLLDEKGYQAVLEKFNQDKAFCSAMDKIKSTKTKKKDTTITREEMERILEGPIDNLYTSLVPLARKNKKINMAPEVKRKLKRENKKDKKK